jgi:hypothetical protein
MVIWEFIRNNYKHVFVANVRAIFRDKKIEKETLLYGEGKEGKKIHKKTQKKSHQSTFLKNTKYQNISFHCDSVSSFYRCLPSPGTATRASPAPRPWVPARSIAASRASSAALVPSRPLAGL